MSKTLRQLSEDLKMTKQGVYNRMVSIQGFREAHTKKISNRILIDKEGEKILVNYDYKDKFNQSEDEDQQQEHKQVSDGDAKELELLAKQLDEKAKQLEVKDKQIEQLNKALDQQQQLQLASLSKVKELEAKLDEKPAKNTKKWWHFWD